MLTIVGIKDTNFKSRDGADVKGITLYTNEPSDNVIGMATDKIFLSERLGYRLENFKVDDLIIPVYNKYGKVIGIQFCD